ncbi:MAG: DUF4102 domain-containing protein, partial [Alphaproteobacteria bacterium]|nr:DUF4102 domain-containing protein [Alphaproteobacteria bacterium]
MRLTDVQCRTAKPGPKIRKISDGGSLQLWIQPTGSRHWRLAYRFDGKQRVFSIGPYPLISLAEARVARDDAKRLLLQGVDPSKKKQQDRKPKDTFRNVAAEYVHKLEKEGRAVRTLAKINWLLGMANTSFGDQAIAKINAPTVLEVSSPKVMYQFLLEFRAQADACSAPDADGYD